MNDTLSIVFFQSPSTWVLLCCLVQLVIAQDSNTPYTVSLPLKVAKTSAYHTNVILNPLEEQNSRKH